MQRSSLASSSARRQDLHRSRLACVAVALALTLAGDVLAGCGEEPATVRPSGALKLPDPPPRLERVRQTPLPTPLASCKPSRVVRHEHDEETLAEAPEIYVAQLNVPCGKGLVSGAAIYMAANSSYDRRFIEKLRSEEPASRFIKSPKVPEATICHRENEGSWTCGAWGGRLHLIGFDKRRNIALKHLKATIAWIQRAPKDDPEPAYKPTAPDLDQACIDTPDGKHWCGEDAIITCRDLLDPAIVAECKRVGLPTPGADDQAERPVVRFSEEDIGEPAIPYTAQLQSITTDPRGDGVPGLYGADPGNTYLIVRVNVASAVPDRGVLPAHAFMLACRTPSIRLSFPDDHGYDQGPDLAPSPTDGANSWNSTDDHLWIGIWEVPESVEADDITCRIRGGDLGDAVIQVQGDNRLR